MNPAEAVTLLVVVLIAVSFAAGFAVGRGRKSTAARGVARGSAQVITAARHLVGASNYGPALPRSVAIQVSELEYALDALDAEKAKALN